MHSAVPPSGHLKFGVNLCSFPSHLQSPLSAAHAPLCPLQVVSTLPALENLFMRYTDLRGRLNCSMLGAATKIQRLSFSGNGDIVGELPSCFFQVQQHRVPQVYSVMQRLHCHTVSASVRDYVSCPAWAIAVANCSHSHVPC